MIKKIAVYMIHTHINAENGIEEVYRLFQLPKDKFEAVWDEWHPQYIIATEKIYRDTKCYKKFHMLVRDNSDSIFIFWAGECVTPDMNIFDYAICYNDDIKMSDRIIRHPTEAFIGMGGVHRKYYFI